MPKRLQRGIISRKRSTPDSNVNGMVRINQPRGRGNIDKGDYSPSLPKGDSFSKQPVSSPKRGRGTRPVINLKALNSFIPYSHFKMEGLHLLKNLLSKNDFMCKVD